MKACAIGTASPFTPSSPCNCNNIPPTPEVDVAYDADGGDCVDRDDRADEAEHHKQDQLQKQKEGKGHWKEELASDSEHHVRPLLPITILS